MKSPFTFSLPFIYKLRYLILIFFITILFSLLACDIVKPKIDQVATPEFDPPGGCYNHLWDRIITINVILTVQKYIIHLMVVFSPNHLLYIMNQYFFHQFLLL